MSFARYAMIVVAATAASLGLVGVTLSLDGADWQAALVGTSLAVANTLAAYALVLWSAHRSVKAFMGAILGGMLGRMGLMVAAVTVALLRFDLRRGPLVVSLLSYFILFLALELSVLQRPSPGRAAAAEPQV